MGPVNGVVDLDSHVMFDATTVMAVLGPAGESLAAWLRRHGDRDKAGSDARPYDDVWAVRGWDAAGAADASDRVAVLDRMGVAVQLVFPTVTLPSLLGEGPEAAKGLRRYNDAMLEWAADAPGRLIPVLQLPASELDVLLAAIDAVTAAGGRAVEMAFSQPPAGLSPAAPDLDPFWARLAAAGIPLMLHVGGGGPFGAFRPRTGAIDPAWGDAPGLRPDKRVASGLAGPFELATINLAGEVFLTAVVLGGVLDRHPNLRIGVAELGAGWVASWLGRLENSAGNYRHFGLPLLDRLPSESVPAQIRIVPFPTEPVAECIAASGSSGIFAFGSDYPHPEGGPGNPIARLRRELDPAGQETIRRFFITNGADLLGVA